MAMTMDQLDAAFAGALPDSMQLDPATNIMNLRKCIDTHMALLRANSGKSVYLPFYRRLVRIAEQLQRPDAKHAVL